MTDVSRTSALPIWGIVLSTGERRCLGHLQIATRDSSTTYTAQLDEQRREFVNETQGAYWLAVSSDFPSDLVVIGRVFDPVAIGRPSTAELLAGKELHAEDLGRIVAAA